MLTQETIVKVKSKIKFSKNFNTFVKDSQQIIVLDNITYALGVGLMDIETKNIYVVKYGDTLMCDKCIIKKQNYSGSYVNIEFVVNLFLPKINFNKDVLFGSNFNIITIRGTEKESQKSFAVLPIIITEDEKLSTKIITITESSIEKKDSIFMVIKPEEKPLKFVKVGIMEGKKMKPKENVKKAEEILKAELEAKEKAEKELAEKEAKKKIALELLEKEAKEAREKAEAEAEEKRIADEKLKLEEEKKNEA